MHTRFARNRFQYRLCSHLSPSTNLGAFASKLFGDQGIALGDRSLAGDNVSGDRNPWVLDVEALVAPEAALNGTVTSMTAYVVPSETNVEGILH